MHKQLPSIFYNISEQNMSYFKRGLLDELSLSHGTDKSSTAHDYMRFYEFYFSKFKDDVFNLLELGVGPEENKGKSLLTWCDYFPNASIVGVDVRPDAKSVETDRIKVEIGNLESIDFLYAIAKKHPKNQILIDDASHAWSHQILAFEVLFQTVLPGGLFVMEDINTSYQPLSEQRWYGNCYEDAFTYFNRLSYLVCGGKKPHHSYQTIKPTPMQMALAAKIDAICFYRDTILIVKK